MQSHAEFKVSYDGPALREHTMDVRDLAPALLSLANLNENQISFSKGDILFCRVRTKQWSTTQGLKTEYEVLEVLDHKPPSRQIPMNFE